MKSDSLQRFSEYLQKLCVTVPYMHLSVIITQCSCLFRLLKICSFFNFKIVTDEDMRHIETSISNKNISIVIYLNPDYHLENHIYFTLPSQLSFLEETFPSIPLHFVQLWKYNANNQTAKITTTSCRLILDSIFCRKMKLCTLSILLYCLLTNALMNV